jgi:hypothetical protein
MLWRIYRSGLRKPDALPEARKKRRRRFDRYAAQDLREHDEYSAQHRWTQEERDYKRAYVLRMHKVMRAVADCKSQEEVNKLIQEAALHPDDVRVLAIQEVLFSRNLYKKR